MHLHWGDGTAHSGENSYFNSQWGAEDLCLSAPMHMENYQHACERGCRPGFLCTSRAHKTPLCTACAARRAGLPWALKRWQARGRTRGSNPGASTLSLQRNQQQIFQVLWAILSWWQLFNSAFATQKQPLTKGKWMGQVCSNTHLPEIWSLNTFHRSWNGILFLIFFSQTSNV